MIHDGLFTRFPKPDFAIGLHDSAKLPAGKIAWTPGYAAANVDSVDITIYGRGGHGAYPHTTIDPIVIAALLGISPASVNGRSSAIAPVA